MKQIVLVLIALAISQFAYCQRLSVDSIVDFYRNADVDCYKEELYRGMKEYDCWLEDTLPKISPFVPFYSPAKIDIRKHDVIRFVALNYYDMANYSEKDNIYDHIIMDSTRCFIFIPLDEKGKPMGITEMYDRFTYDTFINKDDINYMFKPKFFRYLNKYRKTVKEIHAEALIALRTTYGCKFGFIKDGFIYYCWPKPIELNRAIQKKLKNGESDFVHKLDIMILPEYREEMTSGGLVRKVKTGHTDKKDLRICK